MRWQSKVIVGIVVLAVGLALPGLGGWHWVTDPNLQAINAFPLAIMLIMLVVGGTDACLGSAAFYFALLGVAYFDMSRSRTSSTIGVTLVFLHLIFGPMAATVGGAIGFTAGQRVRGAFSRRRRGFEPIMKAPEDTR